MGSKIKLVLEKSGMSVSEFARRISTSRENVYGIFKRQTLDTGLLLRIRSVLSHDFFTYFNADLVVAKENPRGFAPPSSKSTLIRQVKNLRSELETTRAELEMIRKEVHYLRKINQLLDKGKKS